MQSASHQEHKYLFAAGLEAMVLDWLEHACLRDPLHEGGIISSIYFDTPQLLHYRESSNGDFLKSKVRLRWYSDAEAPITESPVRCFLELKRKRGPARDKNRLELFLPAAALDPDPFSQEVIQDLPRRALELGYRPAGAALLPALVVRFRRRRFLDPLTRARMAVDTQICCPAANLSVLPAPVPVALGLGVLEIKGAQRGLPSTLRPLRELLSRSSFSKYSRCLEHLLQPVERRV